ncbi:MAG: hypothetical protein LBD85_04365 [Oscillospiraceae bacterium]|jgi:phage protein D|nr:hypothetical protein [Oscillospiraceae bacterium]
MSNYNKARRTGLKIVFENVNISATINEYLLSFVYTDNADGEADDLQITLQDRDNVWIKNWLNKAVENAAMNKGMRIHAAIVTQNWEWDRGKDVELICGDFEIDSVGASAPPAVITIKGTSLPFGAQIRQTAKNKAWESYTLSAIAEEMAKANGMSIMFDSAVNPYYKRVTQSRTSDAAFLNRLCSDAGLSLKATENSLVIFDQTKYEAMEPILTLKYGDGKYTKYKFSSGTADVNYASCRVRYNNPETGELISGVAYADDYDAEGENNQQLERWEKVNDAADAKNLAEQLLRLHNKFEKSGSVTMPGNPAISAGVTMQFEGFGMFSGKYFVQQARHTVGNSGYVTDAEIRRVGG